MEFLCSVPKPARQGALFRLSTLLCCVPRRLSCGPTLLKYDLQIPNPGLSNLSKHCPPTCRCIRKMSLLATICSVSAAGGWQSPSRPCLTCLVCWIVFVEAQWEMPACLFFLGLCFCKANEAPLLPDAGVELHSWANSRCLLYSMTCLKWHASPKEGGNQRSSRHGPTWSGSVSPTSFEFSVMLRVAIRV